MTTVQFSQTELSKALPVAIIRSEAVCRAPGLVGKILAWCHNCSAKNQSVHSKLKRILAGVTDTNYIFVGHRDICKKAGVGPVEGCLIFLKCERQPVHAR